MLYHGVDKQREIMAESVVIKSKKNKNVSSRREELKMLDNESLIDSIIQLEAHNFQLKRIIKKSEHSKDSSLKNGTVCEGAKRFDFSKSFRRHVFLKFFYLGWNYHGFVEQEDNNNTVEEHIFNALKRSCCIEDRQSSNYHRCGRTDKGVSAFSQVISLDIRSRLDPCDRNKVATKELDYCKIINRLLPKDIKCYAWAPAESDSQSARFDCKRRTYKYFFPKANLNIEAMNEAARELVGSHDFRNFCKMDVGNGVLRFERTITEARVVPVAQQQYANESSGYNMYQLIITSQAFLWHQIRCIMGVLLLVGQAKEDPQVVRDLLDVDSCPSKPQYSLAHELPLILYDCRFDDDIQWIFDKTELLTIIKSLEEDWSFNAIKSTIIRSMLDDLKVHLSESETMNNIEHSSLLQGVQSTKYQPLMKRLTCASLENRIKHYEKKRKMTIGREDVDDTSKDEIRDA